MTNILPENSKKEYPKSITELLRLEGKRFVQGVLLHKQNFYTYLKRKNKYNSTFLELGDILKNRGVTAMIE
jgi:hypothetical protein